MAEASSSSRDVLNTPLSVSDFQYLAQELKEEWLIVARGLNISDADIYNLRSDYGRHSETEVKYQMFVRWDQREAANATRTVLAEALEAAGRSKLATFVLTGVKPKPASS